MSVFRGKDEKASEQMVPRASFLVISELNAQRRSRFLSVTLPHASQIIAMPMLDSCRIQKALMIMGSAGCGCCFCFSLFLIISPFSYHLYCFPAYFFFFSFVLIFFFLNEEVSL